MQSYLFELFIFLSLGGLALYLEKRYPIDKYHFSLKRVDYLHDIGFKIFLKLIDPISRRIFGFLLGFLLVSLIRHIFHFSWSPLVFDNRVLHFVIIIVVSDFLIYWLHRYMHTSIWWQSHKLHHSSEKLDWLSSERADWIEVFIFDFASQLTAFVLGGDSAFIIYVAVINPAFDFFKHANIRINLGFLNRIIANPYEHRWHHAKATVFKAKRGQNFGYRFMIWDRIFGTFYLPSDLKPPEIYGFAGDEVYPRSYLFRLSYSLKNISFYFYRRLRQRRSEH